MQPFYGGAVVAPVSATAPLHADPVLAARRINTAAQTCVDDLAQPAARGLRRPHRAAVEKLLSAIRDNTTVILESLSRHGESATSGLPPARPPVTPNRSRLQRSSRRPTVVDLYCGGGGSSIGALLAGYEVALGIDIDATALDAFGRLHRLAQCKQLDVRDLPALLAAAAAALDPPPDLVIASPKCTPFSSAGTMSESEASQLIDTARAVVALGPAAAIIENVPRARGSPYWAVMRAILAAAGYCLEEEVLDSAKFGVPQRREREFLVATRSLGPVGLAQAAAASRSNSDATLQQYFPDIHDKLSLMGIISG